MLRFTSFACLCTSLEIALDCPRRPFGAVLPWKRKYYDLVTLLSSGMGSENYVWKAYQKGPTRGEPVALKLIPFLGEVDGSPASREFARMEVAGDIKLSESGPCYTAHNDGTRFGVIIMELFAGSLLKLLENIESYMQLYRSERLIPIVGTFTQLVFRVWWEKLEEVNRKLTQKGLSLYFDVKAQNVGIRQDVTAEYWLGLGSAKMLSELREKFVMIDVGRGIYRARTNEGLFTIANPEYSSAFFPSHLKGKENWGASLTAFDAQAVLVNAVLKQVIPAFLISAGGHRLGVLCLTQSDVAEVGHPEDPVYARRMNEVRSSHGPYAGKMLDAVVLFRVAQYSRHRPSSAYTQVLSILT